MQRVLLLVWKYYQVLGYPVSCSKAWHSLYYVQKKIERMHLFRLVLILFSLVLQALPQLVIA